MEEEEEDRKVVEMVEKTIRGDWGEMSRRRRKRKRRNVKRGRAEEELKLE